MIQHTPPPKVRLRQERVKLLYAQGWAIDKISNELKVSSATVNRDIFMIKDEIAKSFNTNALNDIISDAILQLDVVVKEAWLSYYNSKNECNRLGALNAVQRTVTTRLDMLERFGLEFNVTNGVKTIRRKNDDYIGNRLFEGLKLAMELTTEADQLITEGKLTEEQEEAWIDERVDEIIKENDIR